MDQTTRNASDICSKCCSVSADNGNVSSDPMPELFFSTRALASSEADLANEILSMAKADLSRLDINLGRAQKIVAELQHQRALLEPHMMRYLWLLSSIRRLPLELLSEIFMWCVPGDTALPWAVRSHRRAVMVPSQVCRMWRTAALSSPRLWSRIHLPSETSLKSIELAKIWLSRTGGCPLWLKLGDLMSTRISEVILPYSHQWQDLEMVMSVTHSLADAKNRLSRLRTLIITGDGPYNPTQVLDTFELAPQLRTVKLGFYIPPSWIRFPWSQLTEFCMIHEFYSLEECLEILVQAPNLVKCDLMLAWRQQLTMPIHPIQLSRLRSLHLTSQVDPADLFDHLTLPALREFEFDNDFNGLWVPQKFISLLSRSSCSLQSLSISVSDDDEVFTDVDLIGCLELTPALVELNLPLEISGAAMTAKVMRLLTPQSSNTKCLVPNLQILVVYHGPNFDDGAFADMIESRWWLTETTDRTDAVTRIHTVNLIGIEEGFEEDNEVDPSVIRRLGQLASEGMNFVAS